MVYTLVVIICTLIPCELVRQYVMSEPPKPEVSGYDIVREVVITEHKAKPKHKPAKARKKVDTGQWNFPTSGRTRYGNCWTEWSEYDERTGKYVRRRVIAY